MSPHEKPEKRKPEKAKSEATPDGLRPGLERRLRAAGQEKSTQSSKSVSFKELSTTAKNSNHKFTLAALEIIEYAHVEKTRNTKEAIKLAQAVDKEIAAQLRQDDLIAYMGAGRFFVYLPDTAKIESTMVLERLSRNICKKNLKRTIAPQISLFFKLLPAETLSDEKGDNLEIDESLNQWLSRYQITPAAFGNGAGQAIAARDYWKDSRNVMIKRFDFKSNLTPLNHKRITETLLQIQENGLALFPRLYDFQIGDSYLYAVLEPFYDSSAEKFSSLKSVHCILISVCDLFLHLDSLSIVPPILSYSKFKISQSDKEVVYESIEDHLVGALLADAEGQPEIHSKAVESFSKLISKLSEKVGSDDCFSESQEQLKNIASKKSSSSLLQKIRATLKRHEERLRRTEAIGLEGGK